MADKEAAKNASTDDERTIARIEEGPKEAGYAVSGDAESEPVAETLPEDPDPLKAIEEGPKEAGYAITSE